MTRDERIVGWMVRAQIEDAEWWLAYRAIVAIGFIVMVLKMVGM